MMFPSLTGGGKLDKTPVPGEERKRLWRSHEGYF
jgi:hypothetical protein